MRTPSSSPRILRSALAVLLSLFAARAHAGGLTLYEIGTPDLGLAGAGYAARAQDASTILTNPAGLTRLDKSQFMISGQGLYGMVQFTPDANTSASLGANDGGNAVGFIPAASIFYAFDASPDLKLGLGLFSNFGLTLGYEPDWVGRYYSQSATMLGLSVMPSAAWRILPQLSVGLSANIMYGVLKSQMALNGVSPAAADGTFSVESTTLGIGAELGVLFEPMAGTRLGVTYTSSIFLPFDTVPVFTNSADALDHLQKPLQLGMKVPQGVMVSAFHQLNGMIALLANFGWQDWSRFGMPELVVYNSAQPSPAIDLQYKDTFHGALGTQLKVAEGWLVSAGISYDSSMMEDSQRSPALPLGASLRFAAGVQHPVSEKVELGLAYELGYGGDLPIDKNRGTLSGHLSGSYQSAMLHFFALNVNWRP